ncbi:hypothetical protein VPH35_139693 [Triticum aestivum]
MKQSSALNTSASMSSIFRLCEHFSFMSPKNSAMNTGDLAANMFLCTAKDSPDTRNVTSAPVPLCRRSPRCWFKVWDGSVTSLPGMAGSGNSLSTVMAPCTVKVPSLR